MPTQTAKRGRSHAKKCTSLIKANKIYRAGGIREVENGVKIRLSAYHGSKISGQAIWLGLVGFFKTPSASFPSIQAILNHHSYNCEPNVLERGT